MKKSLDNSEKLLTVLAFDFGGKRVGLAVGNTLTKSAQGLTILTYKNKKQLFDAIRSVINEWSPDLLLVGYPMHPDGCPHEMTRQSVRFANQLVGRFNIQVHLVDERYSSVIVDGGDDALAAEVILWQYLNGS